MAHGESSGAGMYVCSLSLSLFADISHACRGLLSLVVQVAMSLNLHRDPDRTPGKFTFFEVRASSRGYAVCI